VRYRKGDTTVDAVLFVPAMKPWPEGVVSWSEMGYQPRGMSWGYIQTTEGKTHILAGDWIITDEAGKHLVSDAVFKAGYVRVSEEIVDETPDIHTDLYAAIRKSTEDKAALYEHLAGEVRDLLPHLQAQDIEDALNMTCVSLSKTPLETLLLIHEFLTNGASIVKHGKHSKE
jgi:hypothetical protein